MHFVYLKANNYMMQVACVMFFFLCAAMPVDFAKAQSAGVWNTQTQQKTAQNAKAKAADIPPHIKQIPAKQIFGRQKVSSKHKPVAIGGYTKGCLAGGKKLAINGPAWQAMRLSRNRNWGHPDLVKFVEKLARDAKANNEWPGLLVGDMAQPRGGPMLTGHRSHQIGLDADIWLRPMPDRILSREERERISAISMLGPDKLSVDPKKWTTGHAKLIKRAASQKGLARIFVHPAIKKALCVWADETNEPDRAWLRRVRPWWGHHYHFHIRMKCPRGSAGCVDQAEPPVGDGCKAQLAHWFKVLTAPPPKKKKVVKKRKPRPPLTLARLPAGCSRIVDPKYFPGQKMPLPVRKTQ